MDKSGLLRCSANPWANGLRLMLLNFVLAVLCSTSFLGCLGVVSSINAFRLAHGRAASGEWPFPFATLLLLYAVIYLFSWWWFGRRLPYGGRARLHTALVGAGVLIALSLTGYCGAIVASIIIETNPGTIPVATVFALAGISTLVLLAGLACIGTILWTRVGTPR